MADLNLRYFARHVHIKLSKILTEHESWHNSEILRLINLKFLELGYPPFIRFSENVHNTYYLPKDTMLQELLTSSREDLCAIELVIDGILNFEDDNRPVLK
jgi:hypothetical protein